MEKCHELGLGKVCQAFQNKWKVDDKRIRIKNGDPQSVTQATTRKVLLSLLWFERARDVSDAKKKVVGNFQGFSPPWGKWRSKTSYTMSMQCCNKNDLFRKESHQ